VEWFQLVGRRVELSPTGPESACSVAAGLRAGPRGADTWSVTSAAPSVSRRRNGAVSARLSPATHRVLGLSIILLALAAAVFRFWVDKPPLPGALHAPWWALALGFGAAEVFVIHLEFRRDTHSISLSEIPIVMGLFFGSPAALIVGHLLGGGVALVAHRKQPVIKLVFNLSHFALEACVALVTFQLVLGGHPGFGPRAWLAGFAATLAVAILAGLLVTMVISLHEGRLHPEQLPRVMSVGASAAIANTALALVAVTALWQDARAGWLLLVMAAIVLVTYRAYATLVNRHASLALLYEFTKVVGVAPRAQDVIAAVLGQARDLLRGEEAELILMPGPDQDGAKRLSVGPAETPDGPGGFAFHELDELLARAAAHPHALVVPRTTNEPELRAYLSRRGWRDCLIAPLHGDDGVIGLLSVANRLGDVSTFDDEDARLFETIANHAGVALHNGRLIDRLRHEALHDSLTGLPNRVLFHERVREALSAAKGHGQHVAVLLMDLDRFKEVNDSLGHHHGDRLLQELGARLVRSLDPSVTVARLGGDEFAVLLPRIARLEEAGEVAALVRRALSEPFAHDQISLELGATIGIAAAPDHGQDSSILLQRADVAMYAAKQDRSGVAFYANELDQNSPRRLALVGDLRRAIEQEQLQVHYQPKVSLATGAVVGVEALVRWTHPEHGSMAPDEFIAIAEHTGLIADVTTYVLRAALTQCRSWERDGLAVGVAVNLSARSLLDLQLPEEIQRLLREAGVEPGVLTLEITEGSVMSDPARTVAILDRLRVMGVGLSVDDFGTGYSSLSYLKRLPVHEVKIDKSFVATMITNPHDASIVRSIVDLGHNLGLSVLAEGVEDEATWERLREIGCDTAQGYFVCRPSPTSQLSAWLQDRRRVLVAAEGTAP
jgi:diguanylate cyclase (GGDEF)-like protein